MLIVNGGLPRSGTVLVGLILQEVFAHHKLDFLSVNLHGDSLRSFVENYGSSPRSQYVNYLIHTHTWSDYFSHNNGIVFWNHRHPLDALVSIMELHDKTYEEGLKFMIASINDGKFMEDRPRFSIPYELLTQHQEAYVNCIANLIGLPMHAKMCSSISDALSLAKVKNKVSQISSTEYIDKRYIKNSKRTMIEDSKTFLNDRHIQNGKYMRYKSELDEHQIVLATKALQPFLDKYGYI